MASKGTQRKLTAILCADVVNIAARLKSLADPGGVCISRLACVKDNAAS